MNVHSNRLEQLALHSANEFACGLRPDYFYTAGYQLNRGRCAMLNHEIGALDAPGRIPAGAMQALRHDTGRHTDIAYQNRCE